MIRRYDSFSVNITNDFLAFEANQAKGQSLIVNKRDGEIKVDPDFKRQVGTTKKTVQGILGMHDLPLGKVLIVITKKVRVGDIDGQTIWRLDSSDILPLNTRTPRSNDEAEAHKRCLRMLADVLSTPYFYFSHTSDLTNSKQREWDMQKAWGPPTTPKELFRRMDHRFLWNEVLLRPFLAVSEEAAVYPFLMPVIHGAVFIHRCVMKEKSIIWGLISRRSRYNVGTRFFARGADSKGNVANFCETEQLVEHHGQISSHVQTRGSMPMIWEQVPNLKYKPDPVVVGLQKEHEEAFRNHFREQVNLYGEQVAVNLIDQKKAEGNLERHFCQLFNTNHLLEGSIHYEAFDFHKECSKMRYERLSLLMDQLSVYKFSYFFLADKGPNAKPLERQTGVFRTNCIDCLDRTNVVQSLLASQNLATVLHRYGVLFAPSTLELERELAFQNVYRNAWADHANLISVQYAGTGALKTDFTRTGVRTKFGLAQDGWNACNRYVKNNFCDGNRTDALRFFVGDLSADEVTTSVSDLRRSRESSDSAFISYLPLAFQLFLALFAITLVMSKRLSLENFALAALSLGLALVSFTMMLKNNRHFVNFPLQIKNKKQ